MKKILLSVCALALFLLASCGGYQVCPTYLQNNVNQNNNHHVIEEGKGVKLYHAHS